MAWNIADAVYDGVTFNMESEDTRAQGIHISPDGTKMYIMGSQYKKVFQYSLTTPWDLSTAIYSGKFFDVSGEDGSFYGLFLKPDGTKLYVVGFDNDAVFQYTLATAWDVSTASYDGKSGDISNEIGAPRHLFFKPDGSKMYATDAIAASGKVYQYSLSTAWDVSTITYDSKYADVSGEEFSLNDVFFTVDGDKMYIIGYWDIVFQYTLSTAWDVSTASYDNKSFDTTNETYWARALFFKSDGSKMYVVTSTPSVIYQYSLTYDYPLMPIVFPAKLHKTELKDKCINFEESMSDICLTLNHNSNVIREYLQNAFGGVAYAESSNLRDVLPSQQLVQLTDSKLADKDYNAIINNFITNVSSMFTLINQNNTLVKTWLDDYMPDEEGHDFTDVKMRPIVVSEDLNKVMNKLFEAIEDNVIILNDNLEILKERF